MKYTNIYKCWFWPIFSKCFVTKGWMNWIWYEFIKWHLLTHPLHMVPLFPLHPHLRHCEVRGEAEACQGAKRRKGQISGWVETRGQRRSLIHRKRAPSSVGVKEVVVLHLWMCCKWVGCRLQMACTCSTETQNKRVVWASASNWAKLPVYQISSKLFLHDEVLILLILSQNMCLLYFVCFNIALAHLCTKCICIRF